MGAWRTRRSMVGLLLLLSATALAGGPALADPGSSEAAFSHQQRQIERATWTVKRFRADPDMEMLRTEAKNARAIFIVPQRLRGAALFGAGGGSGVVLVRDEATGEWSEPAFFSTAFGSFGLQIGVDTTEMILLVLSDRGVDSFYTSSLELGLDATVTFGPTGIGMKGATTLLLSADMVAYARTKGLYVGMSLEGSVVKKSTRSNRAYYGMGTRVVDILVTRAVSNPGAKALREEVARLSR